MLPVDALITDFEKWLKSPFFEIPYAQTSIKGYTVKARQFLHHAEESGIEQIEAVSLSFVKNWIVQSKTGIAPVYTQMVRYSALMLFFDWLQKTQDFPFNPARVLREEKVRQRVERAITGGQGGRGGRGGTKPHRLPPVLDHEEIDQLRTEAKRFETIAGYRDAALVDFLLSTGLRAHEAAGFRRDTLNGYLSGRLRIIGKGNKERQVRFPPPPAESLELWLTARRRLPSAADTLFLTDQGKPLSAAFMYLVIRRLIERTAIHKPQVGPHLLRHTAASLWLAQGMDLRQVQANMGHSNIVVTSRYLHLLE
ncbi:tyrosine-type recombinase/integrase [Acidithiobacillus thiooxidans]|jgi:site-specific recombinase XerD|uniref:Integrase n=2 Tax=Acidithiobacillus thiooxidans TaxID=930 RepID=A0A1C2IYQ4_ACITH|nr:tyrosine-type recombinase/integrase [Acidithiobacillus thiooxidans]MDX5936819.1 tyrosine-type recombinase/integrase [Acidithiobacillus thiooxidans]MDX5936861.1 tyrosine-type recombinase/integrase [Acidithiobacillus thiooxidans]OCX67850.1 integrase [Acidithiobacillus thiooxidans]OCX81074.1 integrase [Acidithiobacillus thiooxidans]TQN49250.1 Tyrosine recombinase XerC [Acidithiobacillus thiooxidans ATCC 19377]